MRKKNSRNNVFPLWAGLLIVSSLAPLIAGADQRTGELSVRVDAGLVSLSVYNVSVQDVIDEIAAQSDVRVVQHVALDRVITLNLDRQPLPDVLDEILKNDSYQLYQGVSNEDEDEAEGSYVELVEYLRMGVLNLFTEAVDVEGPSDSSYDPSSTLH